MLAATANKTCSMDIDLGVGILGKVPSAFIFEAMNSLPKPDAGQPDRMIAEVDVPEIGRVRVRCKLASSRYHKGRNWF